MRLLSRIKKAFSKERRDREALPDRRLSEQHKFIHSGFTWYATIGYYEDGRPGEIFLATAKTGEMGRHLANDAAISASLALQYGCPLSTLMEALCQDTNGEPLSPIAVALSKIGERPKHEEMVFAAKDERAVT